MPSVSGDRTSISNDVEAFTDALTSLILVASRAHCVASAPTIVPPSNVQSCWNSFMIVIRLLICTGGSGLLVWVAESNTIAPNPVFARHWRSFLNDADCPGSIEMVCSFELLLPRSIAQYTLRPGSGAMGFVLSLTTVHATGGAAGPEGAPALPARPKTPAVPALPAAAVRL